MAMILVFRTLDKKPVSIKVDGEKLFWSSLATHFQFVPLEQIFTSREKLLQLKVVRKIMADLPNYESRKKYVVQEMKSQGMELVRETSEEELRKIAEDTEKKA